MSFGVVVDVAIGLVFTYFLLALIASGIQEIIAGVFQWRGTYLAKGIDVILDSSSRAAFGWDGIQDFLQAHFTWKLPITAAEKMAARADLQAPGVSPEEQATLQRVLTVQNHPLVRGVPTGLPSYVSSHNFALALLETLRDGSQAPLFTQVERTIASLPQGDLKRTLSLFLQNASGDLDAFRASLETWFDDAMDRLNGIYTRFSQYALIVIGFSLALALNVDSARLARGLWEDPTLRGQLATAATTAAVAPLSGVVDPSSKPTALAPTQVLQELLDQNLPIGRPAPAAPFGVSTILGWLFTAAAVGLGAPFWFSLLQQLTNLRSAGRKPARADAAKG